MSAGAALAVVGLVSACSSASDTSQAVSFADGSVPEAMNDMTALYGTISNPNSAEVTLTACSAEIAGECQIHEVIKSDGKETMQQVPGGIVIPAGGSVELKSGGYHVMLMGLKSKPKVGSDVNVALTLSNGEINVSGVVESRLPDPAPGNSMKMDSGH